MKLAWLYVILGGILEIFWVSGLKYATSFAGFALTALLVCGSFGLMIIATKRLEVSIAYAVFVGIGAAGVALSEILVFSAPTSPVQLTLIALLILSVIGLKLVSKESDAQDKKTLEEISKDLGIDALDEALESLHSSPHTTRTDSHLPTQPHTPHTKEDR